MHRSAFEFCELPRRWGLLLLPALPLKRWKLSACCLGVCGLSLGGWGVEVVGGVVGAPAVSFI